MPTIPVPQISQIPGGSVKPTGTYKKTAQYVQALSDLLPYYQSAMQSTMPAQAAAEYDIYSQYAPQYNEINQELNSQNAQAMAQSDLDILNGVGGDLTAKALENAQLYDPEYFSTRKLTADSLAKLMGSINLGSDLSGGEQSEIERALNQEGMRRGSNNAPSALDTVRNATRYGSAARNRELENQNQLTKAISAATSFLPTSKSGVDTFQIATGKSSGNQNAGTLALGSGNSSNGQQLFGQIGQTGGIRLQSALQADANSFGNQFTKNFGGMLGQQAGQLGGSVGAGLIGMCWVAREVYGDNNPKWLQFRSWLLNKAPIWFFGWYATKGEKFAQYIKSKPLHKFFVRSVFNTILKYN